MDKSQITKHRRSMESPKPAPLRESDPRRGERNDHARERENEQLDRRRDGDLQQDARGFGARGRDGDGYGYGSGNGDRGMGRGGGRENVRKERDLSPYSKRLALTQAMNMTR
jgi:hypothetical protein